MNKEVGYIWQGFFLLLLVLAGMGVVRLLASGESIEQTAVEGYAIVQNVVYSGSANDGKNLFDNNCAMCHKVDRDLTGPALGGIESRVKDRKLLYSWVRNSPAVLKSGNKYFNDLYNQWNQTPMSVFPSLTDEEIGDILSYIRQYKAPLLPIAGQAVVMK